MTLTTAVSPGCSGCLGNVGFVHPHDVVADSITRGASPVLVNRKSWETDPSASLMLPKSWLLSMNFIIGPAQKAVGADNNNAATMAVMYFIVISDIGLVFFSDKHSACSHDVLSPGGAYGGGYAEIVEAVAECFHSRL